MHRLLLCVFAFTADWGHADVQRVTGTVQYMRDVTVTGSSSVPGSLS